MLQPLAIELCINRGFFSRWLEYTWLPGEQEIYRTHQPGINTAEARLHARLLEFAEALLLASWPQLRGRSVSLERLVSLGLPETQPDPVDFL
jgi:hypothetical protein